MTRDLFHFPHTQHLVWLGPTTPRWDKVMSEPEAEAFLAAGPVLVEEMVDGAKIGIAVDESGQLQVQNRGTYLSHGEHPQFNPLWPWLDGRRQGLTAALGQDLLLVGEWCFAVHSIPYDALPDWFLALDVFDRNLERFWSAERRNALLRDLGIARVPTHAYGRFALPQLVAMITTSHVGHEGAEGLTVRRDRDGWLHERAKIVAPAFVSGMGDHWSKGPLRHNTLEPHPGEL